MGFQKIMLKKKRKKKEKKEKEEFQRDSRVSTLQFSIL